MFTKKLSSVYRKLYRSYGPQHWWPSSSKGPWEVMVGAVLTQNTAWRNVEKALSNLKRARLLPFASMRRVSRRKLGSLIRPAGFFNQKSERLKTLIRFLEKESGGNLKRFFNADTAVLREKLLGLKGIGPETADCMLLYAGNKPVFVIDAYTRRILSRMKIIKGDEPYDWVQKIFMNALPRRVQLYNEYHALLVHLAKKHCRTRPVCRACPLERGCQKYGV